MKLLIIGISSQIGRQLALRAQRLSLEFSGTYRSSPTEGGVKYPKVDSGSFSTLLDRYKPDAVIYAQALTNVDGCESDVEGSLRANYTEPVECAGVCAKRGIKFVFFSSEYVFDGASGPYSEGDKTVPLNVYGRHKLASETELMSLSKDTLIIRTTTVYGADPRRANFLFRVVGSLKQGKAIRVPDDQVSTPTYNKDVALYTLELLEMGSSGIVHVAGAELISRVEFARLIASTHSLDNDLIVPVKTSELNQLARRPLRGGLKIDRLISQTSRPPSSVKDALADLKGEVS